MHPSIPPHSPCQPSRIKDLFPHIILILPHGSEFGLICAGIIKFNLIFGFFQRNEKMIQILDLLGKKLETFSIFVGQSRPEMLLPIWSPRQSHC